MVYKDTTKEKLYLLNDSDNYGFDCYSFDVTYNDYDGFTPELDDGFIPFSADMCCCNTEDEFNDEEELIRKWNEEMTEEEQIDFCLKGMGSSLEQCILLNDEDLEEELQELC